MKKRLILVAVVLLLILVGCGTVSGSKTTAQKVSCDNMKDLLSNYDSFLIDVREASEYEEGHLENAINISSTKISSITTYDNITKDSVIVVYCATGKRSGDSAKKLVELGYKKVFDLGSINNCK